MPPEYSRLRWQCRRGMRELDVLLERFLDSRYDSSTEAQKSAFQALLELPDPELGLYLLQGVRPDSAQLADIVRRILRED